MVSQYLCASLGSVPAVTSGWAGGPAEELELDLCSMGTVAMLTSTGCLRVLCALLATPCACGVSYWLP